MSTGLGRAHQLTRENVEKVPAAPGVYVLLGLADEVAYVGLAASLRARLRAQLERGEVPARRFRYRVTTSVRDAAPIEHELLVEFEPRYNARS